MNTNDKIKKFFDRFKSKDFEENEYNPTVKVARTVQPDVRLSLTDTYRNAHEQLKLNSNEHTTNA